MSEPQIPVECALQQAAADALVLELFLRPLTLRCVHGDLERLQVASAVRRLGARQAGAAEEADG